MCPSMGCDRLDRLYRQTSNIGERASQDRVQKGVTAEVMA